MSMGKVIGQWLMPMVNGEMAKWIYTPERAYRDSAASNRSISSGVL
jgi:hypothetical protein